MKAVCFIAFAAAALAQSPQAIRKAIDRALPPIQRSAATFVEKRACFSCHHNGLALMVFSEAKQRGVPIDESVFAAVQKKTVASGGSYDDVVQARNVSDPTPNDSLLLMVSSGPGQEVRARRLASWQRADGHWITSDFRPPHSSSEFTATATAVQALRGAFGSHPAIAKAIRWLRETRPASTEDASYRLLGLVWGQADSADILAARKDLLGLQRPDGGWAQLPGYVSDAYSTGEAVFALHRSGAASAKGVRFLLSDQKPDGTWHVRTRMISPAEVSPPYFETGFPYKKDQFISYAGSCWAVMALLTADLRPEPPMAISTPQSDGDNGVPALPLFTQLTIAASFYNNSAEVARLLDAGASANPPAGTREHNTPLRYASMSGDLASVKLLLDHGANPNAGSPLSEAVTFGHPDVAAALIAAGADIDGVESTGINLLHWATITNRPALIPVLAKAGVPLNDVDENGFTALMYAATIDFGDTKTLEALLAAGADATIKDMENRTPQQQARRLGHKQLAAALAKKPAR
ncbi:MAG: ankyrin repeat domain-containing protein [Acidobacteriota bacterium]